MPTASPRPPSFIGSTLNTGPTLRSQQPTQKIDASKDKVKTVEDSISGRQWLAETVMLDPNKKLTTRDLVSLLHDIAHMSGTIASYRNAMHAIGYLLIDVTNDMQESSFDSKLDKHSNDLTNLVAKSTEHILQGIGNLERASQISITSINKLSETSTNLLASSGNINM